VVRKGQPEPEERRREKRGEREWVAEGGTG